MAMSAEDETLRRRCKHPKCRRALDKKWHHNTEYCSDSHQAHAKELRRRDRAKPRPTVLQEKKKESKRRWKAANPGYVNETNWKKQGYSNQDGTQFLTKHRDQMLVAQGGVCKLCRKPPKPGKILCADHCHETGKVRGLLCNTCNTALGKLGDNVAGLKSALEYVQAACA